MGACIPPRRNRKVQIAYDEVLYRRCHHFKNLFANLKNWRRVATRYDRCTDILVVVVTISAIIIFWLKV